jgi:hypothetical protein
MDSPCYKDRFLFQTPVDQAECNHARQVPLIPYKLDQNHVDAFRNIMAPLTWSLNDRTGRAGHDADRGETANPPFFRHDLECRAGLIRRKKHEHLHSKGQSG